jgi:hypothetical protein
VPKHETRFVGTGFFAVCAAQNDTLERSTTLTVMAAIHVLAGAAGLLLGPVSMWVPKRRGAHTTIGGVYFAVLSVVCATAAVLSVQHWETRWWFLPIALGTFACGAAAYWAARRRPRGWLLIHVVGQVSSYTGMATAFVVNNWESVTGAPGIDSPVAFFGPMFIGTVAALWLVREVLAGRRPSPNTQQATPGS